MNAYQALHSQLAATLTFLSDKPEETVDSTLRALWFTAAGTPKSAVAAVVGNLPSLDTQQQARLSAMIAQRIDGTPLSHLTQRQAFMGIEMLAGPEALVPRKETELLGRAAIELAQASSQQTATPLIVDVCTGSGNIALAIARQVSTARVLAADLSEAAIQLARRNADHLGLARRITFYCGDLLAPVESSDVLGQVDVLTCNPPYINTAKVEQLPAEIAAHEPKLAFDGGALGIGILMRLVKEAPRFLRAGGWLAFEVGLGQGPALVKRMKTLSYSAVNTVTDEHDAIRVILARN